MEFLFGTVGVIVLVGIGILALIVKCYKKVEQGTAVVRNGMGGSKVSFSGIFVIPIMHRSERMDISVKRVEINRSGGDGLVCKDNMRADIMVAFFVRVNKTPQDVLQVADSLGCERASQQQALRELFDAKFSEALKTVGKAFEFVELYESRKQFKDEILKIIGTDLNGYVLDDCAIDYLEQTPMDKLDPNNILDSEGIKKISELTAEQQTLANHIQREKEKIITKQDVEAREVVLELERQRVEAEERQKKEIATARFREESEAEQVGHQERLKAERARIATDEEIDIAEQNRQRQVIVASKSRERTDAVETERVEKDRLLEVTERERTVALATIAKDKSVEIEKKDIQDAIRDRVIVERAVVEEQEKIRDTQEFAKAERDKQVAVTGAEQKAQEDWVKEVKAAEAAKVAAERIAEQRLIEAEAARAAAEKEAAATKMLAEATTAESAAIGLGEAQVTGAMAEANQKQGQVEAEVSQLKAQAEARGIEEKAEAMKKLHAAGREHEEFRLNLGLKRDVEMAEIEARKDIAKSQADVVATALKTAKIDIVGGDSEFFDKIVSSVSAGKGVDKFVGESQVLTDVKNTFFNGDPEYFKSQLQKFVSQFGVSSEDIKNLSIAALISKLMTESSDGKVHSQLRGFLSVADSLGISQDKVASLLTGSQKSSRTKKN